MPRTCDRCSARMSPFIPRERLGDDLVCRGCATRDANDLTSDRQVAHSLASRTANAYEDSQVQWTGNQPPRPQVSYTEFPHYSDGVQFGAHITCNLCGASKSFVSMGPLQSWKAMHADPSKGTWACSKLRTASRTAERSIHEAPGEGRRPTNLAQLHDQLHYLEGRIQHIRERGLNPGPLIEELVSVRRLIADVRSQQYAGPMVASRTAVEGPYWDSSDPRFSFTNPDYRMGWEDGKQRVSNQSRLTEASDTEAYQAGYAVGVREKQGSRKVAVHDYAHLVAEVEPGRWVWVLYDEVDGEPFLTQLPAMSPSPEMAYEVMVAQFGNPGGLAETVPYDPAFSARIFNVNRRYATRKLAHDSGDGETIYHCPFCGAGQVVGRSDGTAECGFCQTAFTVQVQPQRSSMPQTIDGVPHLAPDLPGGGEVEEEELELEPEEEDDGFTFGASAMFLTAEGVAMPYESYLRHLAIAHADDRQAVIAQVRASR